MPGDSPAGNGRLSGIKAQDGNSPGRNRSGMPIHRAHTGAIANRPPVERTAGRRHGVGQEFTPA